MNNLNVPYFLLIVPFIGVKLLISFKMNFDNFDIHTVRFEKIKEIESDLSLGFIIFFEVTIILTIF